MQELIPTPSVLIVSKSGISPVSTSCESLLTLETFFTYKFICTAFNPIYSAEALTD